MRPSSPGPSHLTSEQIFSAIPNILVLYILLPPEFPKLLSGAVFFFLRGRIRATLLKPLLIPGVDLSVRTTAMWRGLLRGFSKVAELIFNLPKLLLQR